jgi:hypothetical protein
MAKSNFHQLWDAAFKNCIVCPGHRTDFTKEYGVYR